VLGSLISIPQGSSLRRQGRLYPRASPAYGPAAGDPELRAALADKLTHENDIATKPEQVLICNGGKQAIYNLFQVVLNPGDEVLLPSPYWLSYPEMAALAGASTVLIPSSASDGFRLDLDALEARITPKKPTFGDQQSGESHGSRHAATRTRGSG
jgi:aspartate/methionine/tyrosine aminotransferase